MKYFDQEIEKFYTKVKNRVKFSFSKFADGEWAMIENKQLDNGEFSFLPANDQFYRKKLIDSFKYKDSNYFVGISCPCCQGDEHYKMKIFSEQSDDQLTFANLFVNNNFKFYKDYFVKEFYNYEVHLVAHESSNILNLPFEIEKFYPVMNSAWKNNYYLIDEIKSENYSDKLFLFSCGPFGNMLAHELWSHNQNNTYLDVGSTLNFWTGANGFSREYMVGGRYSELVCTWGSN